MLEKRILSARRKTMVFMLGSVNINKSYITSLLMGSDVTGFSQSVESKSDKRSTELHHYSFDPEEISILLLFQRIPHLIVENSAAHAATSNSEYGIF